jgi:hypothetical protein
VTGSTFPVLMAMFTALVLIDAEEYLFSDFGIIENRRV